MMCEIVIVIVSVIVMMTVDYCCENDAVIAIHLDCVVDDRSLVVLLRD